MTGSRLHPDQLEIDEALVRRLLEAQFPMWARLALERVSSAGTENAIYRLGDDMAVRLPFRPGMDEQIEKDHRFLPTLAPQLPLAIPLPLGRGAATAEYPSSWSVCRWLPGEEAAFDRLADPSRAARELAHFVLALQSIDATGGPAPGKHNFRRGVPLADRERWTRAAIARSEGLVDTRAIAIAWERDRDAPTWDGAPVWLHGDLTPDNLLAVDGQLTGVIDWGGLGVGDPATDLLPAWDLFRGESRQAFREAMGVDDAAWARGRGLALSVAVVALPYYLDTNPTMVRQNRHSIAEVLSDHGLA